MRDGMRIQAKVVVFPASCKLLEQEWTQGRPGSTNRPLAVSQLTTPKSEATGSPCFLEFLRMAHGPCLDFFHHHLILGFSVEIPDLYYFRSEFV